MNQIASDTITIKRGKYSFKIPKINASRQGAVPDWLSKISGLDDGSRDYLLLFTASEISNSVRGYKVKDGEYVENIEARLSVLTQKEIESYQNSAFGTVGDSWYGRGLYENRHIEQLPGQEVYKVYYNGKYKDTWMLFKRYPDKSQTIPEGTFDFWIASCTKGQSPITESGEIVSCKTHVFFDDIAVEFFIRNQNLSLVDEVKAFIKAKVLEWKQVGNT